MSLRHPHVLLAATAALMAAGCASTGGTPRPFPSPGERPAAADPGPPISEPRAAPGALDPGTTSLALPVDGFLVAGTALGYRGTPYRFGGSDPGSGFDCSGLVQYVYARHGIHVPREVNDQFRTGTRIANDDVRPGDLFFFETDGSGASHVAIAISARQFVHAPSSNGVVRVEALNSAYWGRRYLGARRILAD